MLPAVRMAPAHELAAAVLAAPLLREAWQLARWVGASRRLTARGLLRLADATAVIADLEIAGGEAPAAHGGLRSASDVRELDLLWHAAVGAGLVTITGNRASACTDALRNGDPAGLLAAWRGALDAVLGCGPVDVREELEGLATVLYAAGLAGTYGCARGGVHRGDHGDRGDRHGARPQSPAARR